MFSITNRIVAALTVLAICSGATFVAAEDKKDQANDARVEASFKRLDTNSDGKLTLEEYKAGKTAEAAAKAETEFKHMDKNNDSSLTYAEFKAGHDKSKDQKDNRKDDQRDDRRDDKRDDNDNNRDQNREQR